MANILTIVELGRSIRNSQSIKVKQPLSAIIVSVDEELTDYQPYSELIQDELNMKKCIWTNDLSAFETVQYKLNFKTAGAAFGAKVNKVKDYVMKLSEEEKNLLQQTGSITLTIDGEQLTLLKAHVLTESIVKEHYILAEDAACRVLLNVQLTTSLLEEGQIRELIRTIQDTRKKWKLPVEQYVSISIAGSSKVTTIIQRHESLLKANVLLKDIHYVSDCNGEQYLQTEVFDEKVTVYFKL